MEISMVEDTPEVDPYYHARADITVILQTYVEKKTKVIAIGSLVQIGRSSLIFEYMPLSCQAANFIHSECSVVVKNHLQPMSSSFSTQGTIDSDGVSPRESLFLGIQARRCKVVFSKAMSMSDIEPFIG